MSHLVDQLVFQIRASKLPDPELEYMFHPWRRWRFDIAWPDKMIAVEVEGGHYVHGATGYRINKTTGQREAYVRKSRHLTPRGLDADCEKYNEAAVLGWRICRVTEKLIRKGSAISTINKLLSNSPAVVNRSDSNDRRS